MIAFFKRPSPARTAAPEAVELTTLVTRIDAMEAEAHRMLIGAYVTQIRELAKSAAKELADERKDIADIPGDPTAWGNLGEGYWEVVLAELSAKDVGRYAREARHWLERHTVAVKRLEAGQGMEPWTKQDRGNHPIAIERGDMEAAQ
jgi:hypothetical protein